MLFRRLSVLFRRLRMLHGLRMLLVSRRCRTTRAVVRMFIMLRYRRRRRVLLRARGHLRVTVLRMRRAP